MTGDGFGRRLAPVLMVFAVLAALGGALPAAASARTVRLTGSVVWDPDNYTSSGSAHCAEKWMLVINVPSDVISYTASVNQPGLGPFFFNGPRFTNPITGYGPNYTVPAGKAGWFLGDDSGPGVCTNNPSKYNDIVARGVLASGLKVHGDYNSANPTVQITVTARNTISPYLECGRDHWSGPKLRLEHGSVTYRKATKISKTNPRTGSVTKVRAKVLFTATFTSQGTFTGKVHLGATRCGEAGYTATLGV